MKAHISLVKDLLASGLTQQSLGVLLGKSQAWVGAVLAGKFSDIKWSDGEALRKLHAERCQPKVGAGDTASETRQEAA
jgi:predicted transcriptional regulator